MSSISAPNFRQLFIFAHSPLNTLSRSHNYSAIAWTSVENVSTYLGGGENGVMPKPLPLELRRRVVEANLIEESWSLIKNIFRSAEAITILEFVDTMKKAQQAVTEQKISGYFKHAGYPLSA